MKPETFVPGTILVPMPEGVRIIANVAPQVNIVLDVTVEQVKQVLERCLSMRSEKDTPIIRAIK